MWKAAYSLLGSQSLKQLVVYLSFKHVDNTNNTHMEGKASHMEGKASHLSKDKHVLMLGELDP